MDWPAAAKEYLLALRGNPGSSDYALRGLAALPTDSAGSDSVAALLYAELDRDAPRPKYHSTIRRAIVNRAKNEGRYGDVLDMVDSLDAASARPGFELVAFAGEAMRNGDEETARHALDRAASRLSDPRGRATVLLATANFAEQDSSFSKADSLYTVVVDTPVSSDIDRLALQRRGEVRLTHLNRPGDAADDFRKLLRRPDATNVVQVRRLLAESLARQDSLEQALDVMAAPLPGEPEGFATPVPAGDVASGLLAARIALWQGRYGFAVNLLDWVMLPPKGEQHENEALELMRILAAADSVRLGSFAAADQAEFQQDLNEAIQVYEQLAAGEDAVAEEARWRNAKLRLKGGDPEPLRTIAADADGPRAERAWIALSDYYVRTGNPREAKVALERLLLDHPDGLLTGLARLKRERLSFEAATSHGAGGSAPDPARR
jgi:hypothetical protein